MKKFFAALAAAAVLFIGAPTQAVEVGNDCVIEVDGTAYPSAGEPPNVTQRTAQLYAYRLLAEHVGELRITSSTTIQEALETKKGKTESNRLFHDDLSARVETVVKGALIKKTYRDPDGSFHAIARLSMFGGPKSIANAVLPDQTVVEDFPAPIFTNLDSGDVSGYTGLIIDCRDMGLDVAIAPSIKAANGTEIYAYRNVTRQMASNRGMVAYADSPENANRAGANPLTVKALFIEGECDAVVSDEDANKILVANQSGHFLNNCMVVFVR